MVLDNHLARQIEIMAQPVLVDEEQLQAGLIERVGIGGCFLQQRETRAFTRREYVPVWPSAGKTMLELAHDEALEILKTESIPFEYGSDLGGTDETVLSNKFDRPIMIHRYPSMTKAFYMQPDPDDPEKALCVDILAPEGYGEIVGGSQRIHDHDLLMKRIKEHNLPVEAFQWYLDIRRYGSVPHSGFGMGIERVVAWITGVSHLRETIPFPRTLNRLYP